MKKGKVYKIISKTNPDLMYIGSTVQKLSVRLSKHKHDYKRYNDGRYGYCRSFDIIKLGDYSIELIKEVDFEQRQQLYTVEASYIKGNRNCVNKYYS